MPFRHSFHFLLLASVFWAFLTLASTGEVHLSAAIVFLAAFALAIRRSVRPFRISNLVWIPLSLAAFGVAAWAWWALGERMYAVTYLLMYLEMQKLLSAETNRDYIQIFGLTFFQVLAASVATESVAFAPMLIVYLYIIVSALISFTVKRDAEAAFRSGRAVGRARSAALPRRLATSDERAGRVIERSVWLDRRLAAQLALASLAVVGGGFLLFWMIPRATRTDFFTGLGISPQAPRRSGYVDRVDFGGLGEIQTDPTIVMRAMPKDPATRPELLRIRGTVLDEFTGTQWRRSWSLNGAGEEHRKDTFELLDADTAGRMGDKREFRIVLEPEASGYIFLPDRPVNVTFGAPVRAIVDGYSRSLKLSDTRYATVSYEVESRILSEEQRNVMLMDERVSPGGERHSLGEATRRLLGRLPADAAKFAEIATVGPREAASPWSTFLQLPESIAWPDRAAIVDQARSWTVGITSKRQMALEIERRFHSEFGYTLDIDYSWRDNHLTHFLQVERRGHCEYFATAMVLMLRSLEIPARIVNGYLTDEWNTGAGGRYLVRQEHAHSWVEARFDDSHEWITFDPTPAAGVGSNRIQPSLYHSLSGFLDTFKMIWYTSVVDYDASDQQRALLMALRGLRAFTSRMSRGVVSLSVASQSGPAGASGTRIVFAILLIMASLGALGYVVFELVRRKPAGDVSVVGAGGARRPPPETIRPYLDLLEDLQQRHPRPPAQTPLDYALHVAGQDESLGMFLPLTRGYYAVRFNGAAWSGELDRHIAELRARLRHADAGQNPSGRPEKS